MSMSIERPTGVDRNQHSFTIIERMSGDLRQCVYEYSFPVVQVFLDAGVRDPAKIHLLIAAVWTGARSSRQGRQKSAPLDWLLLNAGAQISAVELARVLRASCMQIVPTSPTGRMIDASMEAVSGFNVKCTKREKHRRRLAAALVAESAYLERLLMAHADRPMEGSAA